MRMKFSATSFKNRVKSVTCEFIKNFVIIHKLDYEKMPIYLHDNIRLASCKKEPDTVKWIETFEKFDTVFDVGANVGAYSLIMAKFVKRVYSFEPSGFTFNTLMKNVFTNEAFNVTPLNIALSGSKKIDTFVYSSKTPGTSGHGVGVNCGGKKYEQQMLCYSIDDFIKDFNLEPPNHIKLDVDGNELEILKGASKTLSGVGFKTLMVEVLHEDKEMFDYLRGLGLNEFAKYRIDVGGTYNYLFTNTKEV
jgi:FkbM family methyltransferase